MKKEFKVRSEVDGLELDGLAVEPEEGRKRIGLMQISHGMSEYKERYLPFMEYMAQKGIVCMIHDHRGHGKSVRKNEDLGYMYGAGGDGLVSDLFLVTRWAKKEYPDLPFVLLGHSMGSLIVRAYTKTRDQELDALIVCGSPSRNYLRPLGAAVGHVEAALLGAEHRSSLLEALSFGAFAERFSKEQSRFAWCCSDPKVVEEYESNPLCGFTFSDDAFFALNDLLKETYSSHGWRCTRPKLPVLFLSGGDDPCYVSVKRFKQSIDHMRLMGYHNIRGKLYPGMRHEILNEKEKYRVYEDIWKWLVQNKVISI
ncbi:MAG: alpha/beta hydrolase [Lachnospiraceae bacterium]|nr:alpha/beta hydrolase [Lachnospiraceae bacterium]